MCIINLNITAFVFSIFECRPQTGRAIQILLQKLRFFLFATKIMLSERNGANDLALSGENNSASGIGPNHFFFRMQLVEL